MDFSRKLKELKSFISNSPFLPKGCLKPQGSHLPQSISDQLVGTGKTASETGAGAGKWPRWCSCYPTASAPSRTEKHSALTKHIQSPTAHRSLAALLYNNFTYIEFQISWSISKGEDGPVLSLKNEGRFIWIRFTDRLSEWACALTTAMLRFELEIFPVHLSAGWLFKHFLYCWIPQRLRQSIDDEGQHLLSSP